MPPEQEKVAADMRRWLERAVIGLNLCPFAKAVYVKGQVRIRVSEATDAAAALADFRDEAEVIAASDPAVHDTTLLVLPLCLADFLEFNDAAARAERVLRKARLSDVLQVASFHPRYQFDDTDEGDITNATNRAPYPTLHLLREASIDRAVEAFPDASAIYGANMKTLRDLGCGGWQALDVGPSP